MRTEDGYLIHKCLNGESEAFGFLVAKYKEAVYALAYSKLRNFHDAEDLAQEVFIKAYRKLHTLKRSDSFSAWLYSITSNLCKDWIRARAKRPDREFIEEQDPNVFDHPSIDSYLEEKARELIHEALDSLPEIYQQVLSLYYLGGMSSKEIAKFLGTSSNTINQRLMRARAKLKEEVFAMMSATFAEERLPSGFTFRIVEIIKHTRFHPFPRMPWLPWGLSLVTGTVLTLLGLISYPIILNSSIDLSSLESPIEAKVLDIGEIPVDVVKVSEVPVLDGGRGGSRTAPTLPNLRDALAFLFAPQVGEGKWTKKADMPTARRIFSTSMVNGKIYAIGGVEVAVAAAVAGGLPSVLTVEEYDSATDKWTRKSDMPTARYGLSTSVVNGKIYAIGGTKEAGIVPFSIVEEYNPKTDKWTKKADMPTARMALSASAVNGKIYAIGGLREAGPLGNVPFSIVEEYDPKTDKWTKKADMPTARAYLSTSVVNGKIYAIGGSPDNNLSIPAVEEYDPATDKWTKKADMPTTRYYHATSTVNGKIYAIGGRPVRGIVLSVVEEYDPVTDKWAKKADMPTARVALSTSEVNGKIYAIGGIAVVGGVSLSTVEEYDPGFAGEAEEGQGVEAKGKQATTWGKMKK